MAHEHKNPYTQTQKGSRQNPFTKGSADQKTARKLGFDTKSDGPSPSGLKGPSPKKY